MNTFFISGNKRSGSSLLVKLLNLHPRIFISHESDIIWILYNLYHNKPIAPYLPDDPGGMQYTLSKCGHLLDKTTSIQEIYFSVQLHLMAEGFHPHLPSMTKTEILWVGDKKPFQYADPVLAEFILSIFPDTRFLHLVRHPFTVIRSAKLFHGDGGFIWGKMTSEDVLEQWTLNEKRVMELQQKFPDQVMDIRYEDLCCQAEEEMEKIFSFLGVDFDEGILEDAARLIKYYPKLVSKIPCSEETIAIMARFNYKPVEDFYP